MSTILMNQREAIATVTLNRPDKLNALAGSMRQELLAALRSAAADTSIRVVVITGEGRGFCAGGDVEFMRDLQQRQDLETFRGLLEAGRHVVTMIRETPKPVIASINGVAAGAGCSLALACDYRIASDSATIGATFVRIGLHPDWGGTYFLPRLVGASRAMELLMTGRMVEADEAHAIGLFDRVVPSGSLEAETRMLAESFAAGPSIAIAGIKKAIHASETNDLRAQIALETEHQLLAFQSNDASEGMNAFFEKRPARFTGT